MGLSNIFNAGLLLATENERLHCNSGYLSGETVSTHAWPLQLTLIGTRFRAAWSWRDSLSSQRTRIWAQHHPSITRKNRQRSSCTERAWGSLILLADTMASKNADLRESQGSPLPTGLSVGLGAGG